MQTIAARGKNTLKYRGILRNRRIPCPRTTSTSWTKPVSLFAFMIVAIIGFVFLIVSNGDNGRVIAGIGGIGFIFSGIVLFFLKIFGDRWK